MIPPNKLKVQLLRIQGDVEVLNECYPLVYKDRYHKDRHGSDGSKSSGVSDPTGDAVTAKEHMAKAADRIARRIKEAEELLKSAALDAERVLGRDIFRRRR